MFAVVVTVVFFAWLYLPILAVALFSFNDKKSLSTFSGFSLRWYDDLVHNDALLDSLVASLEIATVATVGSLVLGTMLALGPRADPVATAAGSSGRSPCSRSSPPRSSPGWPRCCSSPGSGSSSR